MLNSPDPDRALPIEVIGQNLATCHRCPRRRPMCAGACACLEDGRDITSHAAAGECPLGRYSPQPPRGLGDVVAGWTQRLGIDHLANVFHNLTGKDCGCKKRQSQLNRLVPFGQEDSAEAGD